MVNTSLCYIEKDGCYLMLHRVKKQNDCNKDKWIGIGGKFEETESPYDCVKREVKEETGLTITKPEYRGIVTFVAYYDNEPTITEFMHLFWTDTFSGKLLDNESCTEGDLQWIEKSKMNDIPHWKGDEIFLQLLDSKCDFFSLKLVYKNGCLLEATLNDKIIYS